VLALAFTASSCPLGSRPVKVIVAEMEVYAEVGTD